MSRLTGYKWTAHIIVLLNVCSDSFRSPEFCLCRVQLLAAASVTTVTRVVSRDQDEQYKHFGGGSCCGGKKNGDRQQETHLK